ncbi:polycystic kidney disease protein 1-like 2 [Alosa sapidissima]|uniref:polycystic kidney disease protein 1-like 2 n=1 Tax=Alosa sapidissima TaxID=34773 RepID=UPI001C089F09|nr:polycystic kidney disease protein 1-like 2 [Alosa sapidissima]
MPWTKANGACEKRGGRLLRALSCPIRDALQDMTVARGRRSEAWWVGKSLMGRYEENPLNGESTGKKILRGREEEAPVVNTLNKTSYYCSYVVMDPFKLTTTQYCTMNLSYICQLDLKPSIQLQSANNTRQRSAHRAKRDTYNEIDNILSTMSSKLGMYDAFLEAAVNFLDTLETTAEGPPHSKMMQYMELLLNAAGKSSQLEDNQIKLLISCTGGILSHMASRCKQGSGDPVQENGDILSLVLKIHGAVTPTGGSSGPNNGVVISTPTVTIYTSSHKPEKLKNQVIGSEMEGTYFKLPSSLGFLDKYASVTAEMYSFKENPFKTDSDEPISGTVSGLELKNGSAEISASNLAESFEIYLSRPNASIPPTTEMNVDNAIAIITSFNVTDPDTTVILTMKPNKEVILRLLLAHGSSPNDTTYKEEAFLTSRDNYRWLVTPELRGRINGTWFVNASLNSSSSKGLQVAITIFTTKCMFWDKDNATWSTYGCSVGPNTKPNLTQCFCNHLTFFGSSFFVAPNYIDLSRINEYFGTVSENYVVVVLLSCFFGLYILTLLWACYADRRALRKRKMTLLEDNHPCANYNYILHIQTGYRSGAGTSATVSIVLQGKDGESEAHHLTDPDKPVFERGGVDMFMLSTPFCLGELQGIRLWHDNAGGHPAWYLNKVTIQDLQTRKVWHFLCYNWLSSKKGDELIKRTFTPAKKNELASFSNIFQTRTSSGFRDEHIWVSIVDPPRRSPFTRAQRVSCCMSLLLCTMAINIMFWKAPVDETSPVIVQIGPLEITWAEVIIGVESGLLMFPINILIITIFRSIRPRLQPPKAPQIGTQNQKAVAVAMPTFLKETEDVVNMLSKSPKNQIKPLAGRLQSSADLSAALDIIHVVIHVMQGETESDCHWVHCSHFVLYSLAHLSESLERLGAGAFSCPEEYQCVRSMMGLLLKKAEMVAMFHTTQRPVLVVHRRKSSCWLPWWFVFVGWFLLFSISGVSTFFTLLYGFVYGKEMSIQWVISLGLSLFQSIFVLQPLKVIAVAIFFALIMRPVAVEESEEVEILLKEQQRRREQYTGRETGLQGMN